LFTLPEGDQLPDIALREQKIQLNHQTIKKVEQAHNSMKYWGFLFAGMALFRNAFAASDIEGMVQVENNSFIPPGSSAMPLS